MPRRPAKVTQAEIARAIRAAKCVGASEVTIDGEGAIRIHLNRASVRLIDDDDDDVFWTPSVVLARSLKAPDSG